MEVNLLVLHRAPQALREDIIHRSPATVHRDGDLLVQEAGAALVWAKENAPALVAVETLERLDADAFRQEAERIRAADGELLPGVEYSEGGDTFSLSFPSAVKPKKAKA